MRIKKNTLTPLILAGIFCLMLGLSFAAVPLYDLFCRVTGFGGTTQVSKEAPKVVLDKIINVRLDTNVNGSLSWKFKAEKNLVNVKPGKVCQIVDVSAGEKTIAKANKMVNSMIKLVRKGTSLKNRYSCKFCPYYNTSHCT